MKFQQVIALLNETRLAPEQLAERLSVSASTCRRWMKSPPSDEFPERYRINIAAAVCRLLQERRLSHDSKYVNAFLSQNLPDYFDAAIAGLRVSTDHEPGESCHQDQITGLLARMGFNPHVQGRVDNALDAIRQFETWGDTWKHYIQSLLRVVTDTRLPLTDKAVAYGALFYLIFPFDLIPASVPTFGYVDDFGILSFAAAHYAKQFPQMADIEMAI